MSWNSDQYGYLPGRYTAHGYRTAHVLRTSRRPLPADGSGDRHLRQDRELLGREADRLDRDNFVFETLLNRERETILGRSGFILRMKTPDPALNARMEKDFKVWGKKPEVTGVHSWKECEALALREHSRRGDVGCAFTNRQKLLYVEAARLAVTRRPSRSSSRQAKKIEQGVELDPLGAPLAYWVSEYDKNGAVKRAGEKRVKAEDFALYAHRKKFSQTRGVPPHTTVMPLIHRLNDILDSEAIAWQQLARLTVLFNFDGGANLGFDASDSDDDGRDSPPDLADRVVDLEQGTAVWGKRGEQVSAVPRDLPGANFVESTKAIFRMIGMPSGVPGSVLMLDFSGTTYTSSRAELEQACRVAIGRQRHMKRQYHNPITERWIHWGMEDGRYPTKAEGEEFEEYYKWEWIAPEYPWLDRLKETQGWGMALDRGMATQGHALQSVGMELEDYHAERFAEIDKAMVLADKLADKHPGQEPPHWRMFAGYPASVNSAPPVPEKKDPAPSTVGPPKEDERDEKDSDGPLEDE